MAEREDIPKEAISLALRLVKLTSRLAIIPKVGEDTCLRVEDIGPVGLSPRRVQRNKAHRF
ncbi:hypothetical protein GCM10029976_093070 [Kribbella albertanoniae]